MSTSVLKVVVGSFLIAITCLWLSQVLSGGNDANTADRPPVTTKQ